MVAKHIFFFIPVKSKIEVLWSYEVKPINNVTHIRTSLLYKVQTIPTVKPENNRIVRRH